MAYTNQQWEALRWKRNRLLRETDWTQLSDTKLTKANIDKVKKYRQELRDLPANTINPFNPSFPIPPNFIET